ncbi:MarR family transcriptional regulator [Asanoa siamensis]|uniref:MarR family transcriptional regulator n=1 Tax=Asanoa siamensis TaxID=926357 RepID=A0ABQ4D279_9ACTN|nr:MarR family transcriptional regulator [Asanoa siamensis]GIF77378.1 MarR family transcriptional regulator [Asanoa siamensis]
MDGAANLASSIEAASEALVSVLEAARTRQESPVSPTQVRVLSIINVRPDTNVNGLAELLDVVPSSASRLCDRLEAVGLLRRAADERDRREVRLVLTAAGAAVLRELRERRAQAVQAVLDRMPHRAQHDLLVALLAFGHAAATVQAESTQPRTA